MVDRYEPNGKTWEERANLIGLNTVLDPECNSLSNNLIDLLQKKHLKNFLICNKFKNILDFGCGVGRLYDFFVKYIFDYQGIDITKEMIDVARKNNSINKNKFSVFNGKEIPFKNEYF